jgi:hypothetical protein
MNTAREKVAWAVEFANRDLSPLGSEEWKSLNKELLLFFVSSAVLHTIEWPPEAIKEAQGQARELLTSVVYENHPECIADPDARPPKTWWFMTMDARELQDLTSLTFSFPNHGVQPIIPGSVKLKPLFNFTLGDSLTRIDDPSRIRLCLSRPCRKLFFAKHRRQLFCSTKCNRREQSRRLRQRDLEAYKTRRNTRLIGRKGRGRGRPRKVIKSTGPSSPAMSG